MGLTTANISCIIIVHNGARCIAEAVDSLAQQTLAPSEILVIDDGSTDDSGTIAQHAGGPIVRIVRQENAGVAAARNRGIAEAKHPYVSFLDHDDLAPPGRLESLANALQAQPNAPIAFGRWRNFLDSSLGDQATGQSHQNLQGEQTSPFLTAALIHTDLFKQIGFFDTGFTSNCELDWLLRCSADAVPSAKANKIVLQRRIHRWNRSRSKDPEQLLHAVRRWHRAKSERDR